MKLKKEGWRWGIPAIGVMIFSGLIILFSGMNSEKPLPTETYTVQIVDELYYTDDQIRVWVDEIRNQPGTYLKEIGDYTYLAMCTGVLESTEYAIALVNTIQSNDKMEVVYSVVKHGIENNQTPDQNRPFMLVRLPSESGLKLVGREISESEIPNFLK